MHLFDVYVRINGDATAEEQRGGPEETNEKAKAIFKAMEDGDEKTLALWKRFRDLSIKAYEKVYARLNVTFDIYSGESQVENDRIRAAVETLKAKNLVTTKTKDESRPDWDNKRKEAKEAIANGSILERGMRYSLTCRDVEKVAAMGGALFKKLMGTA